MSKYRVVAMVGVALVERFAIGGSLPPALSRLIRKQCRRASFTGSPAEQPMGRTASQRRPPNSSGLRRGAWSARNTGSARLRLPPHRARHVENATPVQVEIPGRSHGRRSAAPAADWRRRKQPFPAHRLGEAISRLASLTFRSCPLTRMRGLRFRRRTSSTIPACGQAVRLWTLEVWNQRGSSTSQNSLMSSTSNLLGPEGRYRRL